MTLRSGGLAALAMIWFIPGFGPTMPASHGALRATVSARQQDDFAKYPEPEYRALFRLYMAVNGEALLEDPAYVLEYHALFEIPPTPLPKGGVRPANPACLAFHDSIRNEIRAKRIFDEARRAFADALKDARAWPKTQVFRMKSEATLGPYDASRGAFPLQGFGVSLAKADVVIPIAQNPAARDTNRTGVYQGPVEDWCRAGGGYSGIPPGRRWIDAPYITGFKLDISGNDVLKELPMTSGEAEAYLNTRKPGFNQRRVALEAIVEVGPVRLPDASKSGGELLIEHMLIPARIVKARAVNPVDGTVLYEFPAADAPRGVRGRTRFRRTPGYILAAGATRRRIRAARWKHVS